MNEQTELERLKSINAELIEALSHILKYGNGCDARFIAREALVKAEAKS